MEWFFPRTHSRRRRVTVSASPSTRLQRPMTCSRDAAGRASAREIMGAGKFGPPGWQDDPDWTGWWGTNPPFHSPVFVLTHQPRVDLVMEGGTTFHFVDAAPHDVLRLQSMLPMGSTCDLAAGRRAFGSSSPPGWLTTCMWRSFRLCWAAE